VPPGGEEPRPPRGKPHAGDTAPTPRPPRGAAAGEAAVTAASRGERRARARKSKSRKRAVALAAIAALLIGGIAAFALSQGGDEQPQAQLSARRATTTSTAPPAFQAFTTLTTAVPELNAYEEPTESAKVVNTFTETTEYQQPRTLLAIGQQPGWFQALLPMRPNGSIGWVREADVTPGSTTYAITVSLSQHKLTLTESDNPVLEAPIVIGKTETPTPVGQYYITDPVDLQDRPNGAYGAYALGISGYSEVLKSFNGGPGQVAIHGGAYESDLGNDVSNGCIRVINDVILQIANTVPLGTPVTIEA